MTDELAIFHEYHAPQCPRPIPAGPVNVWGGIRCKTCGWEVIVRSWLSGDDDNPSRLLMLPFTEAHKGSFQHPQSSGRRWGAVSHCRTGYDPSEWYKKRGKSRVGTGHNGMEASLAARIPYEIGEAICIAVERRMGMNQGK